MLTERPKPQNTYSSRSYIVCSGTRAPLKEFATHEEALSYMREHCDLCAYIQFIEAKKA